MSPASPARSALPHAALPRATPGRMGVAPARIAAFLDSAAALGLELHSFMLARHGHVVAEGWWAPYRRDLPHMQHSLTKSFTATAVGFAIAEGRLGLDDAVVSFFPGQVPDQPGPYLGAMTVRHLLTMTSGHRTGISGGAWRQVRGSWIAEFFRSDVAESPGTRFVYSSASSYVLSAIVQRVSGERLRDYLEPRLFRPLGIAGIGWDVCPNGVNPGGNGLDCRTEDLVKLGLLHLQGGTWNGQRLLPESWVRDATRASIADASADDGAELRLDAPTAYAPRGYGFHWWTGPGGAYYASGLFGQYAIVLPAEDAVVAFTAALRPSDRRLLDLVWRDLVPALGGAPDEPGDAAALHRKLDMLRLDPPAPTGTSPCADRITGRTFLFEPNEDGVEAVSLRFNRDACTFTLRDHRGEHQVLVGLNGAAAEGVTTITGHALHHQYQPERMRVVASGGWTDEDTFAMRWQFVETAFRDRVVCRFTANGVTLDRSVNVNTGATARPRLVGRLA